MKKVAIAVFTFSALSIDLSGELIDKSESESPFLIQTNPVQSGLVALFIIFKCYKKPYFQINI